MKVHKTNLYKVVLKENELIWKITHRLLNISQAKTKKES
jgi:hypothetical protein